MRSARRSHAASLRCHAAAEDCNAKLPRAAATSAFFPPEWFVEISVRLVAFQFVAMIVRLCEITSVRCTADAHACLVSSHRTADECMNDADVSCSIQANAGRNDEIKTCLAAPPPRVLLPRCCRLLRRLDNLNFLSDVINYLIMAYILFTVIKSGRLY